MSQKGQHVRVARANIGSARRTRGGEAGDIDLHPISRARSRRVSQLSGPATAGVQACPTRASECPNTSFGASDETGPQKKEPKPKP